MDKAKIPMVQKYTIFFRRHSKEAYWRQEEGKTLFDFHQLLQKILEDTTEQELFIKVVKVIK